MPLRKKKAKANLTNLIKANQARCARKVCALVKPDISTLRREAPELLPSSQLTCHESPPEVKVKEEVIEAVELKGTEDAENVIDGDRISEVGEVSHCLICFYPDQEPVPLKGLLPKSKRRILSSSSVVEDDMGIIYLLKMMFQWTTVELNYLMELSKGQSPREWFHLCHSCRLLIFEIQKLEDRMRECRKKIKDKIVKSTPTEGSSLTLFRKQRMTMTQRIRRLFVRQQKRSASDKSEFFMNGDREAEERVISELMARRNVSHDGSNVFSEFNSSDDFNPIEDEVHGMFQNKIAITATAPPPSEVSEAVAIKSQRMFACPNCPDLKKMNVDAFIVHLIFHWRRPNKCTLCRSYLPFASEAIDHHWKHHHPGQDSSTVVKFEPVQSTFAGGIFQCQNCPQTFTTFGERNEHELSQGCCSSTKTEICNVCNEGFLTAEEVRLHKAIDHPEVASVSCYYCQDLFATESLEGGQYLNFEALKQHILETEDNNHPKDNTGGAVYLLYPCDFCGKVIKDNTKGLLTVRTHISRKHLSGKLAPKKTPLSCFICNKEHGVRLWKHLFNTHAKNCICDTCGEDMRPRALAEHNLVKHDILMEGYKKFSCGEKNCHFVTVFTDTLKNHVSVHHNKERKRPHKCTVCGKAFFKSKNLKEHEERHENKETRPYQCEICGGSYAMPSDLYIHKRLSHLNQKFPSTNRKRPKKGVPVVAT